jgi:hypothetical protein
MGGVLLEDLGAEQSLLLREIFAPWNRDGEWPVWQYVDYRLYAHGLVAAEVLQSLPIVGGGSPARLRYGLTFNSDNHWLPNDSTRLELTVAGLWHLRPESGLLLRAFTEAFRFLVERVQMLEPSPSQVVQVTVSSGEVARRLAEAGIPQVSGPAAEIVVRKVGQLLEREPYLWSGFMRPDLASERWELRINPVLREFRGVTTPADYVGRIEELVEPPAPVAQPLTAAPLDVPYAVGYLDAVWKSKTGSRLFVNLDPASVARLTQDCGNEEEFNSLMSALADVLGQAVTPGTVTPPQRGALEQVRDWLVPQMDAAAADRVSTALGKLIRLRHIRVSTQHSDARHKAVTAFGEIGLPFPPVTWNQAWTHIAVMTHGALDVLREEVHAGLP